MSLSTLANHLANTKAKLAKLPKTDKNWQLAGGMIF